MPTISIIATVLNEGRSIQHLLDSLLAQSLPPTEIVLVDGGSSDNTIDIIRSYVDKLPIMLLQAPGCNISRGRNIAIQAAQGDIIAVTDAGVRIPPEWLQHITQPFRNAPETQLVAGFFQPDPNPHSPFEVAMSATVLPRLEEIQPASFLPSSRSVAFRKSASLAIGGYPEWLDYCEDLIFDLRLKARFGDFIFAPQAYVYFKPRTSLRSFFKQYYLYARGDGKADLWRKRHLARYITYLGVLPALALLSMVIHPLWTLLYLLGGAVYLHDPYRRLPALNQKLTRGQKLLAIGYIPVIRVVGDVAKMLGYPVGLWWRWRNHPPTWLITDN